VCCCAAEHERQLVSNYCKYSSVADCTDCTVYVLCGNTLNMTVTVPICEQQSAEVYNHFANVWVISRQKATSMLFMSSFISFLSSSHNNSRNAESIFMKLDTSCLC